MKGTILLFLIHTALSQPTGFLQATPSTFVPALTRPNCFDYTATIFDTDTSNDLGFTTALTLAPGFQCEMDIFTGIARFVYESGTIVQMYGFNSLGTAVLLGRISNGQNTYWFDFQGKAEVRRFVVSSPTGFPVSFRVTIEKVKQLREKEYSIKVTVGVTILCIGILVLIIVL